VCALHGALNFTGTISASSVELGSSTSQLQFEHYEILTRQDGSPFELGRGAMGVTYKAIDINLRCPVALKVINAQFIGEELARRRFVREARAAASVRHTNVASVFHLGMTGNGYFYAMEFVDGKTVRELIEHFNRLEPSLAIEIVKQVAAGLVSISALLEVLLGKDPAQRFQSPAELIKVTPTVEAAIDSRSRITPDRLRSVAKESIKGHGTTSKSLGQRGSKRADLDGSG
jgi:serine/threonine protein kinase